MEFFPQILDFLSLFTSTTFVFFNDLILGAFRCPIFYLSLHLFITVVQMATTSKYFFSNQITEHGSESKVDHYLFISNPLSLTASSRFISSLLGSVSKILLYLSIKYNSILFYQITKLFIIPAALVYYIFILPHNDQNSSSTNRESQSLKDHIQSLALFGIAGIGAILFSVRDVQFSFLGLILAIFCVLFSSAYEIYIHKLKEEYFSNFTLSNSNITHQNFGEILKQQLSLFEFIITFACALIFETGLLHNSNNSIFNPILLVLPNPHHLAIYGKHEKAHIIAYIIINSFILIYHNFVDRIIASSYIPSVHTSGSLYFLIINLVKPLLVLIIGFYMLDNKKVENLFGILLVILGYSAYCILDIQIMRREIRARQMKFQEEEDNLDEPLGHRGEDGIFPNAISTEEL